MKLFAPKYYKEFVCIADKCRHSCCIGWEIDIDAETAEKYSRMTEGYGGEIAVSIESVEVPHFRLSDGDRCPHLDAHGLCRIITNLGEGYLCDICREHPRFYNDTPRGREVGLGISCEEACRIVLGSDSYAEISEIGEADGEEENIGFDAIALRTHIFSILSDKSLVYEEKLRRIHGEFGVSPTDRRDSDWRELLDSLEYLDEEHRELFSVYSSDARTPTEYEKELERALAYFVYRHCTPAADEEEFRAALGFALLCERLLASMVKMNSSPNILGIARIISEEIEYSEDNTEAIKTEFLF